LENEEAKARYRAVKIQPEWVVTADKQRKIHSIYYPVNALDDKTHTTYINPYMLRHRRFYICLAFYIRGLG
jgi:hypothetical protein